MFREIFQYREMIFSLVKRNEDYLARYKESTKKCSEYGSDFYITDRALGLITTESRYYTNVEADFADLGISGF